MNIALGNGVNNLGKCNSRDAVLITWNVRVNTPGNSVLMYFVYITLGEYSWLCSTQDAVETTLGDGVQYSGYCVYNTRKNPRGYAS